MTDYLHACYFLSLRVSGIEKIAGSFQDINLRLIATQCAEKAKEIQETFKSTRKASQKALVSCTPLPKAVEVKQ